jgi:hypothetical protein
MRLILRVLWSGLFTWYQRHLYELNINLKEKSRSTASMYGSIRTFQTKLRLLKIEKKEWEFGALLKCGSLSSSESHLVPDVCWFVDKWIWWQLFRFQVLCVKFAWFIEPYGFGHRLMELNEIQWYSILKQNFDETGILNCYAYLSADWLSKSFQFECQIYGMFGCTNVCVNNCFRSWKETKFPTDQN